MHRAVIKIDPDNFQLLYIIEQDSVMLHWIISEFNCENVSKNSPDISTPHRPYHSTALETCILYFLVIFYSTININANISWPVSISAFPSKGLA